MTELTPEVTSSRICPYPGLRPFSESESIFFKGREAHIEKIIEQLGQHKFIMLTGASGDGKSSLVYAGLIPKARAGFIKGRFGQWAIADFRPEHQPLVSLAITLARLLKANPESVLSSLTPGYSALVDMYLGSQLYFDEKRKDKEGFDEKMLKKARSRASNLLIIVDQFEELFTITENYSHGQLSQQAKLLVNIIIETNRLAITRELPIYIVCTMRSDYIGNCAAFGGLPELIGESHYFIPRLNRNEIYQAINEPAILIGNSITVRLTERLLYDIKEGMDVLPALQHALFRIWKAANDNEMDLIHYAKIGGMQADELPKEDHKKFEEWYIPLPLYKKELLAISSIENVLDSHANELYETAYEQYNAKHPEKPVSKAQSQEIIKKTFTYLTRSDAGRAVRHRMSLGEISEILGKPEFDINTTGEIIKIYALPGNTLLQPVNITAEEKANLAEYKLQPDTILDISHEALIRNWQRLHEWAKEENDSVEILHDFITQVKRWKENGESGEYLLSPGQYNYFNEWYSRQKPNNAWIRRYTCHYSFENEEEKQKTGVIAQELKNDMDRFLSKCARNINRKKTATRLVIAVLSILVVFSVFAFFKVRQQKNIAVTAQKIAKSNEIAMRAITELDVDPTLSFRLAEEAYQIFPADLAKQALLSAYTNPPFYNLLKGHISYVNFANFSPDSRNIITASDDKTLRLWDIHGNCLKIMKGHTDAVKIARYSPDGNKILSSSYDNTAKLWNTDGNCITTFIGHSENLNNAQFSNDGKYVLTCSDDSTARLWNIKGEILKIFRHGDIVNNAIFSPDNKMILAVSMNNSIRLWEWNGNEIRNIQSKAGTKQFAVFSPDGKYIATNGENNSLEIWNTHGEKIIQLYGHNAPVISAIFLNNFNLVVSGSEDETARIWNITDNSFIELKGLNTPVNCLDFSVNNNFIITASKFSGKVIIWDINGSKIFEMRANDFFNSVSFSPNGKYALLSHNNHIATIWNINTKNSLLSYHSKIIWDCDFSLNNKYFVTASWDKNLCLWSRDGRLLKVFKGHNDKIRTVQFSPDSKYILSASDDDTTRVWDLNGECLSVLKGHRAIYSFDGKFIGTGSKYGIVSVWDNNMNLLIRYSCHTASVKTIAFSPDNILLASGSDDNTCCLINIDNGNIIKLKGHQSGIYRVIFSHSGKYIATGAHDGTIIIFDNKGNCIKKFVGHNELVTWIEFSPDDKNIITASSDRTVKLWDLEGNCLYIFKGYNAMVNKARFSPDGKYILTASDDATAKIWNINGELIITYRDKFIFQDAKYSPDNKCVITVSEVGTARIWPLTTNIEDILYKVNMEKERGDVWELSEEDKINYGITEPNDN
ncbi:MAG: hypothetical protein HY738_18775 [Bacteroidia bacterium]|nr:hypothetical protein [Bacteroidia bacterium]